MDPAQQEPDTCGFCNLPKRPETARLGDDLSSHCKCPSASDSKDPSIRMGTVPSSAFRRTPSPRPSVSQGGCPGGDRSFGGGILGEMAGKMEIVSVREKHGQFRKAIPKMPLPVSVILCLMNVVLPGTGTLLSAFTVLCGCETELGDKRQSVLYSLLAALLQLLMAPIIVGWIWSVLWGITFVTISVSKSADDPGSAEMV